jgi:transposase-like protein
VAVAVERQGKKLGRLRMQVIDDCSAAQLLPFVKNNVVAGSNVLTDGWKGYCGLEKTFTHQQILSAQAEHKESVLPGVHLVISLVKRVILGTFQGRFNAEYLQRYLDEYVFRFNRRTSKFPGQRFWRIMQQASSSRPLTSYQLRLSRT